MKNLERKKLGVGKLVKVNGKFYIKNGPLYTPLPPDPPHPPGEEDPHQPGGITLSGGVLIRERLGRRKFGCEKLVKVNTDNPIVEIKAVKHGKVKILLPPGPPRPPRGGGKRGGGSNRGGRSMR